MTEWEKAAEKIGIASGLVVAVASFSSMHWVWPWLGPKLLQPCPMPTGACQALLSVVALVAGRSWAIDGMVKAEVRRRRPETIRRAVDDFLGGSK